MAMAGPGLSESTLWVQVQQLPHDVMQQIQGLYGLHFPIEVRHFCAQWIEEQPWHTIDEGNPEDLAKAEHLCVQLVHLVEEKSRILDGDQMFLPKIKLQQAAQQFVDMYSGKNAMKLVRVLKNCLEKERNFVSQAAAGGAQFFDPTSPVDDTLKSVGKNFMEVEERLKNLQQTQEEFVLKHQEYTKIISQLNSLDSNPIPNGEQRKNHLRQYKESHESELRSKAQVILNERMALGNSHKEIYDQVQDLQKAILDDHLESWLRKQQYGANGAQVESSLQKLESWCEDLGDLLWLMRSQINRVNIQRMHLPIEYPPDKQDWTPYLQRGVDERLKELLYRTFIIEKQPPQVLKKDAKFTATVRSLCGVKLNMHMSPPIVNATIISEEQARRSRICEDIENWQPEKCGDIINCRGQMEYNAASNTISVMFRNMQLKRIRRAEKKGNETVTEEKFAILFETKFSIGGEINMTALALSLPVVVTVHGNQECNALATILWDNAFAETGRLPFVVPDRVLWPQLAEALNLKFTSQVGHGMSQTNIAYIASKLFGEVEDPRDYQNMKVSWTQFNREPLNGRAFTFWEWFYSVMKLTKDWLAGPWKDRLIFGFISKQKAHDWLLEKNVGTFLLRFSDSEMGGITIAWVAESATTHLHEVWNLAPFTEKDFRIRSIGDRVKDLDHLIHLYPDVSKGDAFGKFYSKKQDEGSILNSSGYVRADLAVTVPSQCTNTNLAMPVAFLNSPTSPASSTASTEFQSNMETSDDFCDLFNTDYNPNDIERININDILMMNGRPDVK